jgi:flagellar biosynthetic protein FlhB
VFALESQERSLEPTQAKREEARRLGRTPRSRDLTVALSLLGAFAGLGYFGPGLLEKGRGSLAWFFAGLRAPSDALSSEGIVRLAGASGGLLILACLPMGILGCGIAVASSVLQGGFLVRSEAVLPDASRISPAQGFRRLFSLQSVAHGLFTALKLTAVVLLAAWSLTGAMDLVVPSVAALFATTGEGLHATAERFWRHLLHAGMAISLALVCLGLLDYLFQRWKHERDLRMTPAELREETIRLEGNLEYKSRRRKRAASLIREPGAERPGGEGG